MNEKEMQRLDHPVEANGESNTEIEIDLMELFYRLVENAKKIIAAALVGMLVFGIYSFIFATPMYEATCKLYVMSASDSAINLSDLQIGSYLTSDYQEVFDTWEVHEQVIQNLNLDYTYNELRNMLKISNPSDTRILYVTITADDANKAAMMANEYAEVARNYIALTMEADQPSILSEALAPTQPVSPNKLRNMALGLLLGAFIMIAVITVQFLLDDKIKTAEDIRKYTGMATLAIVPSDEGFGKDNHDERGRSGRKQRF